DNGAHYRCVASLANSVEKAVSREATLIVQGVTTKTVLVRSFAFHPDRLVINTGNSVTWTNGDVAIHTVTSDAGVWDSGSLGLGTTFTFTFTNAGVFRYHSGPQKYMTGRIIVQSPLRVGSPQRLATGEFQ